MKEKQFLFLYPIDEYFDVEIENGALGYSFKQTFPDKEIDFARRIKEVKTERKRQALRREAISLMKNIFRPIYAGVLNKCIQQRYRDNDFKINFAVFDEHNISDIVNLQKGDNVFNVGLDFYVHIGEKKYPDSNFILNNLGSNIGPLRVAGFHMWDCVEKVAKKAYERGIDVLVDEDLTEFLAFRINHCSEFRTDCYPSYDPKNIKGCGGLEGFMEARRKKPWLIQTY